MQKQAPPSKKTLRLGAFAYSALIVVAIILIAFNQMRWRHLPTPAQTVSEIVSNPATWENKAVQVQGIIQKIQLGIIQPFNCWLSDQENQTIRIGVKSLANDSLEGNYVEVTGIVRKGYAWVHPDYPGAWVYFIEASSIICP